jgi:hypothetical protein
MVEQAGALGYFGDARRAAVGTELLERVTASGSLVIRKLGATRAGELAIHRFLSAPSVAERCWRPLRGARSRRPRVGTLPGTSRPGAITRRSRLMELAARYSTAKPGAGLPAVACVTMLPAMFLVSEEAATAIRTLCQPQPKQSSKNQL